MSLVGTRPPTVDEWEKYELHHRARLAAKPGLRFIVVLYDLCIGRINNMTTISSKDTVVFKSMRGRRERSRELFKKILECVEINLVPALIECRLGRDAVRIHIEVINDFVRSASFGKIFGGWGLYEDGIFTTESMMKTF